MSTNGESVLISNGYSNPDISEVFHGHDRVLWNGPHFGRLVGKRGRAFLIGRGWTQLDLPSKTSPRKLAFVWSNKSVPLIEVDNLTTIARRIRPYPNPCD
jgi:hypothetical protein